MMHPSQIMMSQGKPLPSAKRNKGDANKKENKRHNKKNTTSPVNAEELVEAMELDARGGSGVDILAAAMDQLVAGDGEGEVHIVAAAAGDGDGAETKKKKKKSAGKKVKQSTTKPKVKKSEVDASQSVRLNDADPLADTVVLNEVHTGPRSILMPLQKFHHQREDTTTKAVDSHNNFYAVNKTLQLLWPSVPPSSTKPIVFLPDVQSSVDSLAKITNDSIEKLLEKDTTAGVSLATEIRFGTCKMFLTEPRQESIKPFVSDDNETTAEQQQQEEEQQEKQEKKQRPADEESESLLRHLGAHTRPMIVWGDMQVGPFCPHLDADRAGNLFDSISHVTQLEAVELKNTVSLEANKDSSAGAAGEMDPEDIISVPKFLETVRAHVTVDGEDYVLEYALDNEGLDADVVSPKVEWQIIRDVVPSQTTIPGIGLSTDFSITPVIRGTRDSEQWLSHPGVVAKLEEAVRATKRLHVVGNPEKDGDADLSLPPDVHVNSIAFIDRVEDTFTCVRPASRAEQPLVETAITFFNEFITTTVFNKDTLPDVVSDSVRSGLVVPQTPTDDDVVKGSIAAAFDAAQHLIELLNRHPNKMELGLRLPVHSFVGTQQLLPAPAKLPQLRTAIGDLQTRFDIQPKTSPDASCIPVLRDMWLQLALSCSHVRLPAIFTEAESNINDFDNVEEGQLECDAVVVCGFDLHSHQLIASELDGIVGSPANDTIVHVSALNHAGVVIRAHMNTKDATIAKCTAHLFGKDSTNAVEFMFAEEEFLETVMPPKAVPGSNLRVALVRERKLPTSAHDEAAINGFPSELKEMIGIYKQTITEGLQVGKGIQKKKKNSTTSLRSDGNTIPFGPHTGCAPAAALSLCTVTCKNTYVIDSEVELVIRTTTLIDLAASHTTTKSTMINASFVPSKKAAMSTGFIQRVEALLLQYQNSVKRLKSVFALEDQRVADELGTLVDDPLTTYAEAISFGSAAEQEEASRLVNFMQGDFMQAVANKTVDITSFPKDFHKNAIMADLFDAASQCSGPVVNDFEREGLGWLRNLTDRGIITLNDLDDVVGCGKHLSVFAECGVPEEVVSNLFAPMRLNTEFLPCGSKRMFPSRREIPLGVGQYLVSVKLQTKLIAPFGHKRPGDHILVGLATKPLQQEVMQTFPASQVGVVDRRYVVVDDTQPLAVPMISLEDPFWSSIHNTQVARTYTSSGSIVPLSRANSHALRPLNENEQTLVQPFQVPTVGRPLFVKGRVVGFYAPGVQEFLQSALKNAVAAPLRRL